MHVVVTGGLGYFGSHCCVELARAGHRLRIVDNLANSKRAVLDRVSELGRTAQLGIEDMCRDAWRWQSDNPQGYPD